MMKPTDEQLRDPKWWDENAPEHASWAALDERGRFRCWQRYEIGNEPEFKITLVKRPNKPVAPEWTGEGLPPVGEFCEVSVVGQKFMIVEVRGYYNEMVWLSGHGIGQIVEHVSDCQFRPLRTKEQQEREAFKWFISDSLTDTGLDHSIADATEIADAILSKYNLEPKQ